MNKTIGLIQRNLTDGVITSNPLQGARFFNSTIAKLASTPGDIKTESVVCLASSVNSQEKRNHESTTSEGKSVSIQNATIALAYATPTEVSVINSTNQSKEVATEISGSDKIISPKTVKRKIDDTTSGCGGGGGMSENIPRILIAGNNAVTSAITTPLQANIKLGKKIKMMSIDK